MQIDIYLALVCCCILDQVLMLNSGITTVSKVKKTQHRIEVEKVDTGIQLDI